MLLLFIPCPGFPEQMPHATFCVKSGVSLKTQGDSEALGNVWLTTAKPQMFLRVLFSFTGKMARCFNKLTKAGVSERLHNPVYSFIIAHRPTWTKMFPGELKLWQSHRFQLWQLHWHRTRKTVDALLKFAERLQKQLLMALQARTGAEPERRPTQAFSASPQVQHTLCSSSWTIAGILLSRGSSLCFMYYALCCVSMSLTVLFGSVYTPASQG